MKLIEITQERNGYTLENRPGVYVSADDTHLQLDLDSGEAYVAFVNKYHALQANLARNLQEINITTSTVYFSRTPGHRHVILMSSKPLSPEDRLFLQLYLGSDPTRELLSWLRVKLNITDPIFLRAPHLT